MVNTIIKYLIKSQGDEVTISIVYNDRMVNIYKIQGLENLMG